MAWKRARKGHPGPGKPPGRELGRCDSPANDPLPCPFPPDRAPDHGRIHALLVCPVRQRLQGCARPCAGGTRTSASARRPAGRIRASRCPGTRCAIPR